MKIHTVLALASTLTFSSAIAESFNERGENFIASVKIGFSSKHQPVVVEFGSFNERGENFIVNAPVGSYKRYPPVVVELDGFNERGEGFIAGTRRDIKANPQSTILPLIGLDY